MCVWNWVCLCAGISTRNTRSTFHVGSGALHSTECFIFKSMVWLLMEVAAWKAPSCWAPNSRAEKQPKVFLRLRNQISLAVKVISWSPLNRAAFWTTISSWGLLNLLEEHLQTSPFPKNLTVCKSMWQGAIGMWGMVSLYFKFWVAFTVYFECSQKARSVVWYSPNERLWSSWNPCLSAHSAAQCTPQTVFIVWLPCL